MGHENYRASMNKTYIGQDKQPKGKSIVYWIHAPEHSDLLTQGYIGITSQPAKYRWNEHIRASRCKTYPFGKVLKEHSDLVFEVVLVGDNRAYCELMEKRLRPTPNIGWNTAPGGKDGYCLVGGQINKQRWKQIRPEGDCIKWHKQEIALLKRLYKQKHRAKKAEKRKQYEIVKYHNKPRMFDKRNKSGLTGVTWFCKYNQWRSQIAVDKTVYTLGYFIDKYQAHSVYLNAKELVADLRQGILSRKEFRQKAKQTV
jgi:hypothetical protein